MRRIWPLFSAVYADNNLHSAEIAEIVHPRAHRLAPAPLEYRASGGAPLLGYLTDRPFAGSRQVVRHYIPTYRARGMEMEFVEMPDTEIQPHRKALYSKPVVVLTSAGTASAAEDFCVSFKAIGRGKFIGEATNGSTGQPLIFSLPGGGSARVWTKHDTFPDGSEFVGVGVAPDIPVHQSIPDLRAGVDTVLGAALHYLKDPLGIKSGE